MIPLLLLSNPAIGFWPLTTWLIFAYFALACIVTLWKDTTKAEARGELPEGDRPPPPWIGWLVVPQYGILLSLLLFDGNPIRLATVWIIVFVLAVVARTLMLGIGVILLIPLTLLMNRQSSK
jgi:hypothetical protein